MYNGIGLATPRGSGTSGYIQRNLSSIKPRRTDFPGSGIKGKELGEKAPKIRKVNKELLEHERRRQIEIKLLLLSDKLREEGMLEEEIDEKIVAERERLNKVKVTEEKGPSKDSKETKKPSKPDPSIPW